MTHKPTAIQFLMLLRRKAVRRYQNENDQRKHVQMGQCAGNISVQGLDKQSHYSDAPAESCWHHNFPDVQVTFSLLAGVTRIWTHHLLDVGENY